MWLYKFSDHSLHYTLKKYFPLKKKKKKHSLSLAYMQKTQCLKKNLQSKEYRKTITENTG